MSTNVRPVLSWLDGEATPLKNKAIAGRQPLRELTGAQVGPGTSLCEDNSNYATAWPLASPGALV